MVGWVTQIQRQVLVATNSLGVELRHLLLRMALEVERHAGLHLVIEGILSVTAEDAKRATTASFGAPSVRHQVVKPVAVAEADPPDVLVLR